MVNMEYTHIGFRDTVTQKKRLTALAARKTEEAEVGSVTETDLLKLALDRLLDAEEAS